MTLVASPGHCSGAGHVRKLLARYDEVELLLQMGEYQQGADPLSDEAIAQHETIESFLGQSTEELTEGEDSHAFISGFAQS